MEVRTAARPATTEALVRGSRFIGSVWPLEELAAVERLLAALKGEHPGASHHCWAFRFGEVQRFSDGGEPAGTAGRPMLEVLLKRGVDRTLAAVVRYFGGTKLGAGGLARAYGAGVARALDAAGTRPWRPRLRAQVWAPFVHSDRVHRLLDGWPGLVKGSVEFRSAGQVVTVTLAAPELEDLRRELREATRAEAWLEALPES